MTFVGKLFTVLILICSIFLTAVAVMLAASQQNWKEQAMENKSKAESYAQLLNASRNQVEEIKAALERERVTSRLALQRVQVQLLVEQADAAAKETRLADLVRADGAQVQVIQQNTVRLTELMEENERLRTSANELTETLHNTLTRVTSLTDANYKLEGEIARLSERSGQLANDVAQIEKVMTAYGLDRDSLTAHIPPAVEGRVTAISRTVKGLIELSLGSDDGLRVGHRMDVFRDGKYLGAVVVKSVTDNSATAEIVPELNEAPIRENDRVTTQLDSQLRG
ncbi:MAG TPA: hypothetical protein DCQ98_08910 [Planctomycetaceae bacterium]|nr:hypothetical protein [Planctomycetaceae bacterium]HRF02094.1 hypothetical protein [Pirellulaceae bacterium]